MQPWECYKSLMLWELELRVLDKSAMPLEAYRLRPTGLCIQTNKPRPQAALTLSRQPLILTVQAADDPPLLQSWWAPLSTGASRKALVDNECLGKSRHAGDDRKSWSTGYLEHLQRTFRYLVNSPSPSDSVWDSLWDSLWESLWDSLWDSL